MDQNEASQSEAKLTVSNGEKYLVIKKYANRKLYNTETRKYVTLDEVQDESLKRSVIVIDNVSRRDITKKTLAASLVDTLSENDTFSLAEIIELIKKAKA
jgi:polyhydroxyalkanoate synthesis regulator protein